MCVYIPDIMIASAVDDWLEYFWVSQMFLHYLYIFIYYYCLTKRQIRQEDMTGLVLNFSKHLFGISVLHFLVTYQLICASIDILYVSMIANVNQYYVYT